MRYSKHVPPLILLVLITFFVNRNLFKNGDILAGLDTMSHVSIISFFSVDYRFMDLWNEVVFGDPTPFTFTRFLGFLIYAFRLSPLLLFNIFMIFGLIMTACFMYLFVYNLTKNRLSAIMSSFTFTFNQWLVSKYCYGHLLHVLSYSLLPLLFLFIIKTQKKENLLTNAIIISIILNIFIFLRFDPIFYVILSLIIFYFLIFLITKSKKIFLDTIKLWFMITIVTFILSIFMFLPLKISPSVLITTKFPLWEIKALSLDIYNTLLGHTVSLNSQMFFVEKLSWKTNPILNSLLLYKLLVLIIPIFAFITVIIKRNFFVLYFSLLAILSIFLAKSFNDPLGEIYLWFYNNIPFFSNIHVPNRWIQLTWFSYSVLIGILINEISKRKQKVLILLILLSIFTQSYFIFIRGFEVFEIPSKEIEPHILLSKFEDKDFRIITVPFTQAYMFDKKGILEGDIGRNSYYIHKKPVINALTKLKIHHYSKDFINFIENNIKKQNNTKISKILGIFDTKYIVLQGYPPTAPFELYRLTYKQHKFFENQKGLIEIYKRNLTFYIVKYYDYYALGYVRENIPLKSSYIIVNKSPEIYENQYWIPRIFSPKGTILVVGGLDTFLKLAEIDNFNFSDWNLLFADHVVENLGKDELIRQINGANYVFFVNAEPLDLAMLISNSTWIKANKFEKESSGWEFDDSPIIEGYAVYFRDVISAKKNKATAVYKVNIDKGDIYEVWIRVLKHKRGGKIKIIINEKEIKTLNTFSPIDIGFEWVKVGEIKLDKGEHKIKIVNINGENKLNGIVIVNKGEFENSKKLVENLTKYKKVYLIDLDFIEKYCVSFGDIFEEKIIFEDYLINYWNPSQNGVKLKESSNRVSGKSSLRVDISPRPNPGPVIYVTFTDMQNWNGIKYITFWFKGAGKGEQFNIWIYFNNSKWPNPDAVRYGPFYDNTKEWRQIVIPVDKPVAVYGKIMWDKVSRIVLTIPDKNFRGTIYLDRFSIYRGEINRTKLENILNAKVLLFKNSKPLENYTIKPKNERNITYLEFKKLRPSKWIVRLNSTGPYILVFSNTYHKMWRAYVNGEEYRSIPSYYFINSFYINETGEHEVVIEFIGQRIQIISLIISGLAYLFAISYLIYDWRRNNRWARALREKLLKYLKIR